MASKCLVLMVHGTFARNAAWTRDRSRLRLKIVESCADVGCVPSFDVLDWSGSNWSASRISTSIALAKLIEKIPMQDRKCIFLVGHSHGGSAIAQFLKSHPEMGEQLGGAAFLSTPFFALREKRNGNDSVLASTFSVMFIVYFMMSLGTLLLIAQVTNLFDIDLGGFVWAIIAAVAISAFVFLLSWFENNANRLLGKYLKSRIKAHQTCDFPHGNFLILRSAGDEAAVALSFAQFLSGLTNRIFRLSGRIFVITTKFLSRIWSHLAGKFLFLNILANYSMWLVIVSMNVAFLGLAYLLEGYDPGFVVSTGLESLDQIEQTLIWMFWYPYLLGTLLLFIFVFVQVLAWLVGAAALLGFGWFGVFDPLFLDFSIEPLPYGKKQMHLLDWTTEFDEEVGLNHSQSYSSKAAIEALSSWIAESMTSYKSSQI